MSSEYFGYVTLKICSNIRRVVEEQPFDDSREGKLLQEKTRELILTENDKFKLLVQGGSKMNVNPS